MPDLVQTPPEEFHSPLKPVESPAEKPSDILKPADPEKKEIILANGVSILIQKPKYPVNMLVARVLGKDSLNPMLTAYYKALTWVAAAKMPTDAGYTQFKQLKDKADFDRISALVGDDGLEQVVSEVFTVSDEPLDKEDLKNE